MRKLLTLCLLSLGIISVTDISAQRIQQPLGRGVVAVKNGSSVLVSWRKLAQEPENATYNIYTKKVGTSEYTKLNTEPLTTSNFSTTTSKLPVSTDIVVALVINGEEKEKSAPFRFNNHDLRGMFFEITYNTKILPSDKYTTKFVWPADLTGDGEYDYVVDRLATADGLTDKIEGYTRFGEHLWTIDMGPNVRIDRGHNDMVIAYDINCNGKSEVIIKSSDGTRFWNSENKSWGEYLLGKEDTDGDGIIDYETQNKRNPPQYITVIDGMTGKELSTIEMPFPSDGSDTYSRDNKSNYMDSEYAKLNGHMGICYLDGVHPSVAMEYMVRGADKNHHYYVSAWGYDFSAGNSGAWKEHFTWSRNDKRPWPAEFHHIRVADVSLDGRDEILDGGFGIKYDGTMLFSAGISHGDRFRVGDIDPDRPGLETFAIQQNAGDMLGQILYDAATGEPIKKWYMGSVGDVGRGECMDIDPRTKGYEMWSTMGGVYSAKGDLISDLAGTFPTEGIWWDGELDKEYVDSPDGNGFNADIRKYNKGRLIEIGKMSGYTITSEYGKRAMFWGDIIGDWREEIVLRRGNSSSCTGIVGFSTDYFTDINNIYCLQEDPNYRMQCTTRGYYQTAYPGFYLGYDMSRPQLPPCMVTDLVWSNNTDWSIGSQGFKNYQRTEDASFENGKSVLFDLQGSNNININSELQPSVVYVMPPKGKRYEWNGTGSLAGKTELWKSQNGELCVNIPLKYSGTTYVSEGILELNNVLYGPLDLRAKGSISGNPILNDTVVFEGSLNYEGCRLMPGTNANRFGVIKFNKSLNIDKEIYFEADIETGDNAKCDLLEVNGNFELTGTLIINFKCNEAKPTPGKYEIIKYSKDFIGSTDNIIIKGIQGLSYDIINEGKSILFKINEQRGASDNVFWQGNINSLLDFSTNNLIINGENTTYVADDKVTFNDNAISGEVIINEDLPTSGIVFNNNTLKYIVSGNGAFSGNGGITKIGSAVLDLKTTKNSYTGPTIIEDGTVTIYELTDGEMPSSIGASTSDASNLQIGKATLSIVNANTATNRALTLNDTAVINIPSGITSLKGLIKGKGTLVKSGSGQLNITYDGTNTWSGGTIIKSGTLAMGTWRSTFGNSGSKILAEGGAINIFDNNNTSAVPSLSYEIEVPKYKSFTINAGSRCYIKGKFTGEGSISMNVPYVRTDFQTEMKDFKGTLKVKGNQFRLNQATDMSGATLELGDVYMAHFSAGSGTENNLITKIGSLKSSTTGGYIGKGTYKIGYLDKDDTFDGTFGENALLHKYGIGSLTLTGSNKSPIVVYEGTLITKNTTSPITTGSITINSGATLSGVGKVSNVTINQDGNLKIGLTESGIGNIDVEGNCTLKNNAVIYIKTRRYNNDYLQITGNLNLSNPVINVKYLNNGTWNAGDEITIFKVTGKTAVTGEIRFEPEIPGDGLEWDYSELETNGKLKVKVPSSIDEVKADTEEKRSFYDVLGRKVNEPKKGFYIINNKKEIIQ